MLRSFTINMMNLPRIVYRWPFSMPSILCTTSRYWTVCNRWTNMGLSGKMTVTALTTTIGKNKWWLPTDMRNTNSHSWNGRRYGRQLRWSSWTYNHLNKPSWNSLRRCPTCAQRNLPRGTSPRKIAANKINRLLKIDIMEPATSKRSRTVVFAPNRVQSLLYCVDCQKRSAVTVTEAYPLPWMIECINSLGGALIFSTLNANSGYQQVEIDKVTTENPFCQLVQPISVCTDDVRTEKRACHLQRTMIVILFLIML